jgi:HPt (histidine-containing phosphotransfer) domain-containing protein
MEQKPFRYDIKGLANDMEVDIDMLADLYSEYFHEMKTNLQESKSLANSCDWDRLERVMHNIKGISISLNVEDIYSLSNKLDNDLKNSKYDNATNEIIKINEAFQLSEKDIKNYFKENNISI